MKPNCLSEQCLQDFPMRYQRKLSSIGHRVAGFYAQPVSGFPHDSTPGKKNCLISTSSLSTMPNPDTSPGFWHWRALGLLLLSCYWQMISWSPIISLFPVSSLIQYEGQVSSQACLLVSLGNFPESSSSSSSRLGALALTAIDPITSSLMPDFCYLDLLIIFLSSIQ